MPDRQKIDVCGLDTLVTDPKSPDTASSAAIRVNNLYKIYKLYPNPRARLMETFHPLRRKYHWDFYALKDINFEVKKGEVLGIIGRNGSGKSTLLKIISGLLQPTVGSVQVTGSVSALLELGSGFNPEVTGIENVYFYGSIMGFNRDEIEARLDEIISFADIGNFVDQPVKTYSSGMILRLAFAVQACLEPDVLLVDEILSVGDIFFQQKCHARMEELIARKTAVVIASHNMQAIEKYSTKVMLLDNGCCPFLGQPNEVVERYYQIEHTQSREVAPGQSNYETELDANKDLTETDAIPDWPAESAFFDLSKAIVIGELDVARCTGVALCNDKGLPSTMFHIGDAARFYFEFQFLKESEVPVGGVVLTDKMNINIHGKNSLQYLLEAPRATKKGTRVRFRQTIHLDVAPGEYSFQVALATISAADYARVTEMDARQLNAKLRSVLRVRQVGIILVYMRKEGLSVPFYGHADLKGDCALSILN
ncbi:MAG: ABC transporter ATP-binding protein [Candidatus Hodarchaeota archaeon]